jgi:hypothetical protein
LKAGERPRLEFFSRIRQWSQDRLKWAVRLPIERLWPGRKLAISAKPAAIIILKRNPSTQRPVLYPLVVNKKLVSALVRMNFYEARHFLNLVQKSGSVSDFPSWFEEWRSRERALLEERLQEIPVYQLELPSEMRSPTAFRSALVSELTRLVELAK